MARTKAQENIRRGRRANELSAVAQAMDGWMRRRVENQDKQIENLEEKIKFLKIEFEKAIKREKQNSMEYRRIQRQRFLEEQEQVEIRYITMITRRQSRINQLESQWEDMANTLYDAIEENEKLRSKIQTLEEQLLDCTCFEKETLSDNSQ
jgi:hypothetical protein